jgi:hypothetical protein
MAAHDAPIRTHCQNCGGKLSGPYCSACGQHDVDYHRSFWHFVEDSIEGFFHLDGKFLRSVRYLFTRPGFLTTEFMAGRRTRYSNPLRFYIFASFVFFAVDALEQPKPKTRVTPGIQAQEVNAPDAGSRWGWLDGKIKAAHDANGNLDGREIGREFGHLMPTVLFLCMPLLAALLKVAYLRGGRFYVEHLIFALHTITLVFLASLVGELAEAIARLVSDGAAQFAGFACFCLTAWLIYHSFRVVYGEGRGKTLLKLFLVGAAFGVVLLIGIGALSIASYYIVAREAA